MRKSAIAAIAVLLALLGVAGLFLFDHGGQSAPVDLSRDDPAVSPRGATADGGGASASRTFAEIAPIESSRFVEAETGAAPVVDDTLRVLVLEEPSGLPVAGAEVAWMEDRPLDVEVEGPFGGVPLLITDFDKAPHHGVTDARGIAIARTAPKLVIAARQGAMFGWRKFTTAPRGEVRLVMIAGPMVAARVVTPTGDPAPGVPVILTVLQKIRGGSSNVGRRVVTRSPDGVAISDHPALRPEGFKGEGIEVSAQIEGTTGPPTKVPLERLREGPITLTLKQTGRVVVKVTGPDGKPLSAESRIRLMGNAGSGKGQVNCSFAGQTSTGTREFPFVPVNLPLTVTAESPDLDAVYKQDAGPLRTPGEELTVEVRMRRKKAVLSGRVTDESGTLLRNRDLRVELFPLGDTPPFLKPDQTRTDAEGMLALSVDRQLFGPKGCDLSLEIDAGSGRVERSAVVLVAAVSDADETPVGDIRMAAPDLLVTGVVVDDDGVPLSNALVTIEDWQINPQKGAGRGTNVAAALARFRTWTDGAGAFEMPLPPRVRAKINGFSVAAEHPRHLCRDRVRGVQKGAKDVKVVLHGAGRVEGSLLLPELAPVRRLEMIILRSDVVGTMGVKKQRFDDCVDSDGRFRSTDLMPGTVTVSIRMPPFPEPLVEIPDVAVPRLGVADDPRLASIDLRAHPALRR